MGAAVELFEVPAARLLLLTFIFIRLLPRLAALQQQYQNIKNVLPAFSGAGKSTLADLLLGLLQPEKGSIC